MDESGQIMAFITEEQTEENQEEKEEWEEDEEEDSPHSHSHSSTCSVAWGIRYTCSSTHVCYNKK